MSAPTRTGEATPEAVPLPITGELDLHTFRPSDLGQLLPAYFTECRARGIRRVRVIHGKGIGTLRTSVHSLLRRCPQVRQFSACDETGGSWGATQVELIP